MSWHSSAGSPRRSGSVTAGRWTPSPPASSRCSWDMPRVSSSTTSATERRTGRPSASAAHRPRTTSRARSRPASGPAPDRAAVEAALPEFTGTISQRPPAYSAIKVAGRRAYALARAGETVLLATRDVTVHSIDLVSWDDSDPDRPIAVLDVACSAGTYIRALARDLGESVGSAAYLGALTRTASGPFDLDAATALDEIRSLAADGPAGLKPILRPIDSGLDAFPVVVLTDTEVAAVAKGQYVRPAAGLPGAAEQYRLTDGEGRLVAIASAAAGRLAPDKVFISPTSSADAARRAECVGSALDTRRLTPDGRRSRHRRPRARARSSIRRRRRVRWSPSGPSISPGPPRRRSRQARCQADGDHVRSPSRTKSSPARRRRCCSTPKSDSNGWRRPASR